MAQKPLYHDTSVFTVIQCFGRKNVHSSVFGDSNQSSLKKVYFP